MENILAYGFMQRALLSGAFIAIACAILGIFLVLRRDAMIGHGLSHVTFGGIALGLFLDVKPLFVALVVAILCALIILKLKAKAGLYEDTAIGIFSSVGMAIGIILATISGKFNVDLFGYLFGNILAIETFEVGIAVALALAVIIVVVLFYQELGIKMNLLDVLLAVLTSVTVVIGLKVVGILLVAALLVIPSAAGLQVATTFRQAMVISSTVSLGSLVVGLFIAYFCDLPASGVIVLLSFCVFLIFWCARAMRKATATG